MKINKVNIATEKTALNVSQQQPKALQKNPQNDKFCEQVPITNHKMHIGFCYTCADNRLANHLVTFCRDCNKDKNKEHTAHKFGSAKDFK